MRNSRKTHLARSLVAVLGAALVIAGAGLAAARTMTGPPWEQPLLPAACDTTNVTDSTNVTDGMTVTDVTADDGSTTDCATTETTDPVQQAADAQAFFERFSDDCGTSVLGDTDLTDAGTDPSTVEAYGSLVDALDSGQVDHMVQSVRVLLENCKAHANDGLRTALYHHGVNWLRQYEHELWLEQKFAERWPDGKPGNPHVDAQLTHGRPGGTGHADAQTTHGKPGTTERVHGNPHDADPSWAPGGGSSTAHGNGNGHTR